ncbi:MAG: putative lipid II flippase FtsW [Actinobacteria bacterium]|uniref:peptidoglycan glycosyltransferase n=1 Tax=freshwater metagenome TaxID=449393 RepID=A0A6J6CSZ8_9ZZZZ|nr:putative lipid II flippase FtsW [Actinomycetota bacterium]
MTRLSPAERARQSKSKPGRQVKKTRATKIDARNVSRQGAERLQVLFDRVFKAQSIYFYRLLGVTLFLVIFGVVMVLSASSIDSLVTNDNSLSVFLKQLMFAIAGLLALSLVSLLPISFIKSKAKIVFAGALLLQLAVLFIGKEINGNRNWLDFGLFSIQPSEFLKIAVILHVSVFLAQQQDYLDDQRVWYRALGMMGLAMGLVLLGRDLGTVIIMVISFVGLLALAGMPTKLLQQIGVLLAIGIPIALMSSSSRRGRINAWLNPSAPDPLNYNWQSEHGMWAISAGRIFGSGLGESKMKWSWIPEVENDFIFAIIAEELGLIGALVVIALFVFLAFSLLKILQRTADPFSRFVVSAILLWLTFQALVNIAVVLRLLPVLGVPLPLISAGGSSLIAALTAIGVVLAIERENHLNPQTIRRGSVRRTR